MSTLNHAEIEAWHLQAQGLTIVALALVDTHRVLTELQEGGPLAGPLSANLRRTLLSSLDDAGEAVAAWRGNRGDLIERIETTAREIRCMIEFWPHAGPVPQVAVDADGRVAEELTATDRQGCTCPASFYLQGQHAGHCPMGRRS